MPEIKVDSLSLLKTYLAPMETQFQSGFRVQYERKIDEKARPTLSASATVVPSTGRKARPGMRPRIVRFLLPSPRTGLDAVALVGTTLSEQWPESIEDKELLRFQ